MAEGLCWKGFVHGVLRLATQSQSKLAGRYEVCEGVGQIRHCLQAKRTDVGQSDSTHRSWMLPLYLSVTRCPVGILRMFVSDVRPAVGDRTKTKAALFACVAPNELVS